MAKSGKIFHHRDTITQVDLTNSPSPNRLIRMLLLADRVRISVNGETSNCFFSN